MYVGADYDPLDTDIEGDTFTMDFAAALASGETIDTATATLAALRGNDSSAATRLSGSVGISGTKVSQAIDVRGAPASVYYRLTFAITTSLRSLPITRWSHFWSRTPN